MRYLKLYLETSVWNFYFADDAPEKKEITRVFFQGLQHSQYEIYISNTVLAEIDQGDEHKKKALIELVQRYQPDVLASEANINDLAELYIQNKVLPPRTYYDAQHIAFASVYELDLLLVGIYDISRMCVVKKKYKQLICSMVIQNRFK